MSRVSKVTYKTEDMNWSTAKEMISGAKLASTENMADMNMENCIIGFLPLVSANQPQK